MIYAEFVFEKHLLTCRNVVKKAVKAMKAASQASELSASNSSLQESIAAVHNQIQTAASESVNAVTEGVCLSMHCCRYVRDVLLNIPCKSHCNALLFIHQC